VVTIVRFREAGRTGTTRRSRTGTGRVTSTVEVCVVPPLVTVTVVAAGCAGAEVLVRTSRRTTTTRSTTGTMRRTTFPPSCTVTTVCTVCTYEAAMSPSEAAASEPDRLHAAHNPPPNTRLAASTEQRILTSTGTRCCHHARQNSNSRQCSRTLLPYRREGPGKHGGGRPHPCRRFRKRWVLRCSLRSLPPRDRLGEGDLLLIASFRGERSVNVWYHSGVDV
jgi:hypothetical protein